MKWRDHGGAATVFGESSGEHAVPGCPPYHDVNFHRWPAGRAMDRHGHDFLQIVHVLQGQLHVDTGWGWQVVSAGWAHVLPVGATHRLRTDIGHVQMGLNFLSEPAATDSRGIMAALRAAVPQPLVLRVAAGDLPGRMQQACQESGALARLTLGALLDQYVLAILTAVQEVVPEDTGARLLAWLTAHADQAITVAAAARACGLGRSRAQAVCQQWHGCGIAHLHERLRLQRAARLLAAAPELSVTACAEQCGYQDVYAFSRAFRRVHGCAARDLRRRLVAG